MEKIGQVFQTARLKKKISLEEASRATKIKAVNLQALEEGDVASLPSPAYARGFIKIYARYLDVDPAPLLKAYEVFFRSAQPELVLVARRRLTAVPWLPPIKWRKLLKIVSAVVLAFLAVLGGVRLFRALRLRSSLPAFPLHENPVAPGGAVLLDSSKLRPPPPPVAAGELLLEARAEEDLWLEVFADETLVFYSVLKAGSPVRWRAGEGFRLRVSRPDRIALKLDGTPVKLPSAGSAPLTFTLNRRGVSLND